MGAGRRRAEGLEMLIHPKWRLTDKLYNERERRKRRKQSARRHVLITAAPVVELWADIHVGKTQFGRSPMTMFFEIAF